MAGLLLVYGGTFDPVHCGHVAVARAAADAVDADRVLLIPCGDPPHRGAPVASGALRSELLQLAFAGDPRFVLDEREVRRPGPSYMADTLTDLRAEYGQATPLALLLGLDAARGLPSWQRWTELPALAHLVLVPRPGGAPSPGATVEAAWSFQTTAGALLECPAGRGYALPDALSDASSTASREALAKGLLEQADLPASVRQRLRQGSPYLNPTAWTRN